MALGLLRTRPFVGDSSWSRLGRAILPFVIIRPRQLKGFSVRVDTASMGDYITYEELFLDEVYDLDQMPFTPDTVIDCGAHKGFFTLLAFARYGSMRGFAFEPDADNFAALVDNLRRNGLSVDARREAVSNRNGTARFVGGGNGGHLTDVAEPQGRGTLVQVIDLMAFVRQVGSMRLLLKVDVEGEERMFLPDLLSVLPRQCAIFFEWHHPKAALDDMIARLSREGFSSTARNPRVFAGQEYIDVFAERH
jgi:FkbM family methyltransferase